MRRFLSKKFMVALVLCSMGVFLFIPQTSYAADALDVASWVANTFYGSVGKALYELLQTPLSWILSLAGQILDFTITLSLSATDLFNSPAVNIGWKAVRDIFNMFFIFSLIYISIKTILKAGGYKTSDALKNVIIGAVLINFSLYFTKIVIDISNVFAVWIYNGIQGLTPGGGGGISKTIQDIFSFEKMFQTKEVNDVSAFVAIFALIFLYAASIKIFLEVSFLFITRTVMFVFLLIMSPVGFVGEVFPKLASESKRWKEDLIGQALVAPVFLLLLYVTLLFVDNIQQTTLFLNKPEIDSTTKSSFTFVDFALFMITYFMIKKSLDVAKDFSGKSGDMITGAIKGGLGIALGGIGVGVAGRLASVAAKSATISNLTNSSSALGRMSGRAALTATNAIANSSFGLSGALKESKLDKALPKSAFKDIDKGYVGKVKAEEKAQEQYAATLGKGIKGEIARQKYAQDMKKTNSLFDRTILSASIGTLIGRPAGIGAADDIQKKADAAFKKEAKKLASKANKKTEEDPQIRLLLSRRKEKAEAFGDRDLVKLENELEEVRRDTSDMSNQQDKIEALEAVLAPGREKQKIEKEINDRKIQILNAEIKELSKVGIKIEKGIEKDPSGEIKINDLKEVEKELDKIIKTGEAIEKQEKEDKIGKVLEDKPAEEPKTKPSSE